MSLCGDTKGAREKKKSSFLLLSALLIPPGRKAGPDDESWILENCVLLGTVRIEQMPWWALIQPGNAAATLFPAKSDVFRYEQKKKVGHCSREMRFSEEEKPPRWQQYCTQEKKSSLTSFCSQRVGRLWMKLHQGGKRRDAYANRRVPAVYIYIFSFLSHTFFQNTIASQQLKKSRFVRQHLVRGGHSVHGRLNAFTFLVPTERHSGGFIRWLTFFQHLKNVIS